MKSVIITAVLASAGALAQSPLPACAVTLTMPSNTNMYLPLAAILRLEHPRLQRLCFH